MSLKMGKQNVRQERQLECPSKWGNGMSHKKGDQNVLQKGQTGMSLKRADQNVPQNGQLECPSKWAAKI